VSGTAAGRLAQLWPYLAPDRWRFLAALGCVPIVAALGVAQPLLMKEAIDEHVVAGVADGLLGIALAYLAVVLAAFVAETAYTLLLSWAAENSILRLRRALFRQILGLAQRFFERQPTGQILTRVTSDVDALSEALSAGSVSLVLDVVNMLAVVGAMLWLDPHLTGILLLVGPPVAAVIDFFRRRMRVYFAEIRDALASLNAYTAERLAGVEVLQLFGQEARAQERFRILDDRHRVANIRNNVYDAGLYAFIDGIASVCVALMLWYGAREVGLQADGVTVGLVVAFVDYLDRLFRPLREVSGKITFIQRADTALEKIFWLLGVEERIGGGSTSLPDPRGELRVAGVSFRYRPEAPDVLHDVSFEVRPGEVVALVGRTGSGKSTLVRLLGRVHDGYRGSITVDDVELAAIAPASARRTVGIVRQEVQLFSQSLRFNVTLGDPGLDPTRVAEAVALSNLDAIAARHPDGLDHPVRDRGANLSAGEAQIIALARTLARDPAVVILDEATASVDPLSERLLQEAMDRVFARKTCLVVAHRLSTIVRADRIVVLDQGRVVEVGDHAELLARGGAYAQLYAEGFGEVDPARVGDAG